jgi:hypothetical protein
VQDLEAVLQGSLCPAIDRPIDNTALQAYLACPREYFLGMVLHRRGRGKSPALVFGSTWHEALKTHYITNGDRAAVQTAIFESWEEHGSVDDYRTVNRVLLDYDLYVKKYGKPSLEPAKTVGWPDAPIVEIATNAMGFGLIHPWAGKIDRVIATQGLMYIEDHKTTSRLDKNYFSQFNLSYQMMGYTFLGKCVMPNEKVAGVRINLSHVLTNKTEFHQQLFVYSEEKILEWVANTNVWLRRLNADHERFNELAKEFGKVEEIPWQKLNEAFPAHWGDNGCSRKFGLCHYNGACGISPQLRFKLLEREFEVNPWNPLEAEDE